jgi:hypothetical protein
MQRGQLIEPIFGHGFTRFNCCGRAAARTESRLMVDLSQPSGDETERATARGRRPGVGFASGAPGGALWENVAGQAELEMGREPDITSVAALRLARLCREHESVLVVRPPVSRGDSVVGGESVRFIGLDVHLDFCEIASCENGRVRAGGRVPATPEGLSVLASSLGPDDVVALEATGNALDIARRLEPHVAQVVVATSKELRAITAAKVKTDRHDVVGDRAGTRRRARRPLRGDRDPGLWR